MLKPDPLATVQTPVFHQNRPPMVLLSDHQKHQAWTVVAINAEPPDLHVDRLERCPKGRAHHNAWWINRRHQPVALKGIWASSLYDLKGVACSMICQEFAKSWKLAQKWKRRKTACYVFEEQTKNSNHLSLQFATPRREMYRKYLICSYISTLIASKVIDPSFGTCPATHPSYVYIHIIHIIIHIYNYVYILLDYSY